MTRIIIVVFAIGFVFGLQFSCSQRNEVDSRINVMNPDVKISSSSSQINGNANIVQASKKLFLGCWSSGNANVLYIKPTTLQTRNSYKELRYKDVTDENAIKMGVYLLEMLDSDESNELQKYVAFKILSEDEMKGKDYDSYSDFVNDNESGQHARWVKDKCETVQKFIKRSH